MMRTVFDLSRCPASFDVVSFLMSVEQERLAQGAETVDIAVLPGPQGGFRADNFNVWPHTIEERRGLLDNIVMPMLRMLPAGRNVRIEPDRSKGVGAFGFDTYSMHFKKFVEAYSHGIRPLAPPQTVGVPAYDRHPLVTITLRECEHWPERNSNLPRWIAAADIIRGAGYRVFFIRDTRRANDPIAGHDILPGASIDLDVRASVYRAAACNLGVSNGPMWFAIACNAPVLLLKPTCEQLGGCYGSGWFKACGIEPGGQLPFSSPHHRIAWEEDTAGNIVRAFEAFMGEQRVAA